MSIHCVGNFEQNLYHDSYFYSVFWDTEEKTLKKEMVGSTAFGGGSYTTQLTDDQTAWFEVNAYVKKCHDDYNKNVRQRKLRRICEARSILKSNGVHTAFCKAVTIEDLEDIAAIFSKRVRNNFKLKMRDVVKEWRPGKYKKPLSEKQMSYIRRPLKDMYGKETKRHYEVYHDLIEYNKLNAKLRGIGYT